MNWLAKGLIIVAIAMTALGAPLQSFADDAPASEPTATEQAPAADNNSSNWWDGLVQGGLAFVLSPIAILSWAIFKIASFILGVAGIIFNWVMVVVVFKFAEYLGNSPGMLLAWGILRDFGNIALIFGFVYIGIRTILDVGHFSTGKALASLVVAAVLMNFSLFAAEAVIDTTNVLSTTLYEQSYDPGQCNSATWLGCAINHGIAGQILQKLAVTSAFSEGAPGNTVTQQLSYFSDPIPSILKFLGLALLVTVAAMVLFAGAFMLISRGVVLAFLMVTSPIGLAGMAVPPLKKLADEWWSTLVNQAFFAPVFILLLLVSLKMTEGLNNLTGSSGGLAAALSGDQTANTGPLILFALVIGFMIAALTIANRFGIYASDFATGMGARFSFGAMGMLGRHTAGKWALRKAEELRGTKFARSRFGRMYMGGLDLASKGNYNVLSTAPAKGIAGIARVTLGHQQHGGYDHIVHETDEKVQKYGQKIENTAEEKGRLGVAEGAVKDAEHDLNKAKGAQETHAEEAIEKAREFAEREKGIQAEAAKEERAKAASAEAIIAQQQIIDRQIKLQNGPITAEARAASEAAVQAAERQIEALRTSDERRAEEAETQIELKRTELERDRATHAQEGRERAAQTKLMQNILKQRQAEQAALGKELNPQRLYAKTLDEDLKRPLTRLTVNTDGIKHAMHGLDKYAGQSSTDRLLQRLTATVEKQGQAMTGAVKSLEGEVESNYHEQVHGDKQDDSPGGAHH